MDMSGAALLGGHVAASVARNAVATTLVFGVALALGFDPRADALQWLGAIGILLAFVLALSWLSAAIGLLAGSPEAANGFTFLVMFLPYASSAFVPVDTMPSWLQGFAGHQPVTPVVDTLRALLLDQPVGDAWWQALLWCGAIAAVSLVVAAWRFGRR
jgi:ABC-2 type transport system permease protein